ncbi:MAG: hypothetical protein QM754_10205 [Tepidisphaeraceae bacterium]
MKNTATVSPAELAKPIDAVFALAARKVRLIEKTWDTARGTPVFTVAGEYTTRGWTEWTEGFVYGDAILAYEHTGEKDLLEIGRRKTLQRMASHVTHTGVHDHGFNNLSTYGNLRRLMREGTIPENEWEKHFYELAIKSSGAVQAYRWSGTAPVKDGKHTASAPALGYVYSFNGPHSLFVDTMRTIRIMGVAWQLGHKLMHEGDRAADLLKRSVLHGLTTSQYVVFHGDSSHTYDVRGRTCHEAVFNRNDGAFRCRSTQQGYSPFSTWTRGLAWAMLGYAEELEFFASIDDATFEKSVGLKKADVVAVYERCAKDTCDHYLNEASCADGITYWDDGAPGLAKLPSWQDKPADLGQDFEPVDAERERHRRAGPHPPGPVPRQRGRLLPQRGPGDHQGAHQRAVPVDRRKAPGPLAAQRLPLAERLGLRARRPKGAVRRKQHVGRLPLVGTVCLGREDQCREVFDVL